MTGEAEQAESAAGPSQEIVSRAKEMGWCPKEEWRGNPEHWVDADTFVEKGETLMPLLKANNRRLSQELQATRGQLTKAEQIIAANTEAIEELKRFNSASLRQQAQAQKKELTEAIVEARREGNVAEELELTERLTETTKVLKETENQPVRKKVKPDASASPPAAGTSEPTAEDVVNHPDFKAWREQNPWFGQDKRKSSLAMGIAAEMREDPKYAGMIGKPFLDAVVTELEATLGGGARERASKVEGGGSNGSGNGSSNGTKGGKTYANLPAEAKAACDKQGLRLVGEGRAYKTQDEWRKAYATKYFEE